MSILTGVLLLLLETSTSVASAAAPPDAAAPSDVEPAASAERPAATPAVEATPPSTTPGTGFSHPNTCGGQGGSSSFVVVPFDVESSDGPIRRKMTRYIKKINCSNSLQVVRRLHRKAYDLSLDWAADNGMAREAVIVEVTKFGRPFRLPAQAMSAPAEGAR